MKFTDSKFVTTEDCLGSMSGRSYSVPAGTAVICVDDAASGAAQAQFAVARLDDVTSISSDGHTAQHYYMWIDAKHVALVVDNIDDQHKGTIWRYARADLGCYTIPLYAGQIVQRAQAEPLAWMLPMTLGTEGGNRMQLNLAVNSADVVRHVYQGPEIPRKLWAVDVSLFINVAVYADSEERACKVAEKFAESLSPLDDYIAGYNDGLRKNGNAEQISGENSQCLSVDGLSTVARLDDEDGEAQA